MRRMILLMAMAVVISSCGADGAATTSEPGPADTVGTAVTSFASLDDAATDVPSSEAYSQFTIIGDGEGGIEMSVPGTWSDVVTGTWVDSGDDVGRYVFAAPVADLWFDTWGMEGVWLGVSRLLSDAPEHYLDLWSYSDDCDHVDRFPYRDGVHVGSWDLYANCGDEGSTFITIAARPPDLSYLLSVEVVVTSDADLAAIDEIVTTLRIAEDMDP